MKDRRSRRSAIPKQRHIVSPTNRQNVGWIVQPKMPIYIFKIERHGGVPLKVLYNQSVAHKHNDFDLMCVVFFVCEFQNKNCSFLYFVFKFLLHCII